MAGLNEGFSISDLIMKATYSGYNPEYIGYAFPGTEDDESGWRIKKMTYDSNNNVTSVLFADGDCEFDNVWDDRASYTYS